MIRLANKELISIVNFKSSLAANSSRELIMGLNFGTVKYEVSELE